MSPSLSPNRLITYVDGKSPLNRTVTIHLKRQKRRTSIAWGLLNIILFAILIYDLLHTCVVHTDLFQYVEYCLVMVLFCNACYHLFQYLDASTLNGDAGASPSLPTSPQTPPETLANVAPTPFNITSLNWRSSTPKTPHLRHSPLSFDRWQHTSNNRSFEGDRSQKSPGMMSGPQDTSDKLMHDEQSLSDYLKGYKAYEGGMNYSGGAEPATSLQSSFGGGVHSMMTKASEYCATLKQNLYQLSTETLSNSSPTTDLNSSLYKGGGGSGMEIWYKLNVNAMMLTEWTANMRMWLSQTVLERLVKEFAIVDESLQKQGIIDVAIGRVSVERLRKTVQMPAVAQFIPTLSLVVPFLDLTPNQEYLVQRIRELAQGGCVSDFRWNGGSSFDGKPWHDALPTDSAIVMHLFVTYMDTQLLPRPNRPDVKPFSGYHYVKCGEPLPQLTERTLAIQCACEKPPYYRVIVGDEIVEMPKGYNNLLHTLLLFLYNVARRERGMLGHTNLGECGVNVLWVIDEKQY